MKLADLIDLEAQIAVDASRDDESLRARDRAAYAAIVGRASGAAGGAIGPPAPPARAPASPDGPAVHPDRAALLTAWLAHLRAHGHSPDLGRRVLVGYRWLGYLLTLGGLAAGWGLANLLLRYDQGSAPINVGLFLAVVVGLQLLSLLVLLLTWPLLRAAPDLPVLGDLRAGLRGLAALLSRVLARADDRLSAEQREAWRVARSRLRMRAERYQPVERWLLLEKAQLFGLMLNLGLLAATLRLVLFSDLAFAWSTTAEFVDAELVHRITSALSLPWAAWLPEAVPSAELVAQTQYFRLEGGGFRSATPGAATDPALAGGWWRFLVAAAVTYGLLPRLLLWGYALLRRVRALAGVPLDTADIDAILRRMRAPLVETRPATRLPQGAEPAHAPVAAPTGKRGPEGGACALVLWRDLPADAPAVAAAVRAALGYAVTRTERAGGADFAADEALVAELGRVGAPVVLLAEGWEAPDKSVRTFLAALREASPAGAKRFVALVERARAEAWRASPAADVKIWRDRLSLLEDPYLSVEPLEAAP